MCSYTSFVLFTVQRNLVHNNSTLQFQPFPLPLLIILAEKSPNGSACQPLHSFPRSLFFESFLLRGWKLYIHGLAYLRIILRAVSEYVWYGLCVSVVGCACCLILSVSYLFIFLAKFELNCHKTLIVDKAQRGDNSKSFCTLKWVIACKYTWQALQKSATFLWGACSSYM